MRRVILHALAVLALVLAAASPAAAHTSSPAPPQCWGAAAMLGNVSTSGQAFWISDRGGDCIHLDEALVPKEWTLAAGAYFGSGWCLTMNRQSDGWHQTYRGPDWFLFAQGDSRTYFATVARC